MSAIPADMRAEMLRDDVAAAGPEAVALFEKILAKGETPEWAAMCALQQPTGTRNTDRAFCEGQRRKMERMSPANRAKMVAMAKQAGINTDGKFYVGGLGRYNDPKAWVSCADDVITSAKLTKSAVSGVLNCDYMEHDKPVVEPKLAPDLVAEFTRKRLQADPALAEKVKKNPKKLKEVQESVIDSHSGRRKRAGKVGV